MKRIGFLTAVGFACIGLCALFSCSADIGENAGAISKVEYEMGRLASVAELDAIATRGDDSIVDWQLSREFAELRLESSISAGEYPADAELWEIPIAIYDAEGNIEFYEFRVVSKGKVIAYITGTATKKYNCPILYQSLCDGCADEIAELYDSGRLSADELPRKVDNGYPRYVFGVMQETRGAAGGFDSFVNPKTGNEIEKDDITYVASYEELIEKYPELFSAEIDDEKMRALIAADNENGRKFWQMAVANKGHIADFATRGGSKRTALEEKNIEKAILVMEKEGYSHMTDYGACGPVAAGFVLDYLQANYSVHPSWKKLTTKQDKRKALYDKMNTGGNWIAGIVDFIGEDGDSVTLPSDIGKAISHYSDYEVSLSGYAYPKSAINDNLPGISLRTFGEGGMHYRVVVAYDQDGWWAFSWPYMKILDLVDCADRQWGSWEAYIPVQHLLCWNVSRK